MSLILCYYQWVLEHLPITCFMLSDHAILCTQRGVELNTLNDKLNIGNSENVAYDQFQINKHSSYLILSNSFH